MRRLWLIPAILLALSACAGDQDSVGPTSAPGGTTVTGTGGQLDPSAPPNYPGSAAGVFQSTDNDGREWIGHSYAIDAGGPVDVAHLGGNGCVGWARPAPDVAETIAAGQDLEVFFAGPTDGWDAALVVRDPAGNWACADDSPYGINPQVLIPDAAPGLYQVWVTAKQAGVTIPGTLTLSTATAS